MNADDLLKWLEAGGQVTEQWKRRGIGRPRKIVLLHCSDGGTIPIQRSTLNPLIRRGLLTTIYWMGDEYTHRLKSPIGDVNHEPTRIAKID